MTTYRAGYFFKITDFRGCDLRTGRIDYLDAVGEVVYLTRFGDRHDLPKITPSPVMCSGDVLHASRRLRDALRFAPRYHYRRGFRVLQVYGTPVVEDTIYGRKSGFFEFQVVREIGVDECVRWLRSERASPVRDYSKRALFARGMEPIMDPRGVVGGRP